MPTPSATSERSRMRCGADVGDDGEPRRILSGWRSSRLPRSVGRRRRHLDRRRRDRRHDRRRRRGAGNDRCVRRHGLRCWCGRRRGCRRRGGGTPRRKQRERVDVVVVGAEPDPEVEVRQVVLRVPRRSRLGDRLSRSDVLAALDEQRAEVHERGPVPVAGRDRHGQAVRGDGACERDLARGGSTSRWCAAESDVDSSMLPRRVLVAPDDEPPQHGTVCGPGPRPRRRAHGERPREREPEAERPSRCPSSEHGSTVASVSGGGNAIDDLVTGSRDRARSAMPRSAARRPRQLAVATPRPRRARRRHVERLRRQRPFDPRLRQARRRA